MGVYEYIQVFEAIIYGAIVTEFLKGFSRLIIEWGTYKFSLLYLLIVLNLFLFSVQRYFSGRWLNHYGDIDGNTLTFIFYIILPVTFIYVMTYIFIPKSYKGLSTIEHAQKYRRHLAVLFFFPLLGSFYRNFNAVLYNFSFDNLEIVIPLVFILLLVLLYLIKSIWYYYFFNVIGFMALVYFIVKH